MRGCRSFKVSRGRALSRALLMAAAVQGAAEAGCGPPPSPPPPQRPAKVVHLLDVLAKDSQGLPTRWSRLSSPNFTIYFLKYSGVAQLVLDSAEEAREAQFSAWGVRSTPWGANCSIYFYPTTGIMRQMTVGTTRHGSAQAPASRLVKGALRFRRINLAADDRGILEDTLPHELSHLMLSELMAPRTPPRWANEGLAMQNESHDMQVRRARAMAGFLERGIHPFPLGRLFAMKRYPDNEHLFYSQTFLLMRVLIKAGGPLKVLAFLKDTADLPALRRHFGLTEQQLNKRFIREARRLAR